MLLKAIRSIRTGSLYTMVHIFKELVPPDTWFTQEVEVVTKNYRGKVIPHFKVKVNDDDPKVRENRLKLLNEIRAATRAVADFSRIEG